MASGERVILALAGVGKTADATQLAIGVEQVAATSENLVGISLMAHIPHKAVVGRVEHVVQRHHDVHGTHARGEMARIGRQLVNDETAQLVAHLRQLVD